MNTESAPFRTGNPFASLTGKVAIVTGAGGDIGRETASTLAREGMKIACLDLREGPLNETVARIAREGGVAFSVVLDITNYEQVEKAIAIVHERYGRIDLLVNNAGLFHCVAPAWEADLDAWERDVKVNLFGTFYCSRATLPYLQAQNSGAIVNLDGGGGSNAANPGGTAYGASKAGVIRFTETLARELERTNSPVLVFAVHPGFVRSGMTEKLADYEWQVFVRQELAAGHNLPSNNCGKRIVGLLKIAGPEFNGRIFDEFTEIQKIDRNRRRIVRDGLYVMQTRKLSDLENRTMRRLKRLPQRLLSRT